LKKNIDPTFFENVEMFFENVEMLVHHFFENVGLLFLIMLLKNYWGFGVLTLALQVNSDFALIFSTLCPCFPN
jgi:hypothetical protein